MRIGTLDSVGSGLAVVDGMGAGLLALEGGRPRLFFALDAFLVGLPVDGGDGGQTFELHVVSLEVVRLHLELQTQRRLLQLLRANEPRIRTPQVCVVHLPQRPIHTQL